MGRMRREQGIDPCGLGRSNQRRRRGAEEAYAYALVPQYPCPAA